jgi:hypothetical protein
MSHIHDRSRSTVDNSGVTSKFRGTWVDLEEAMRRGRAGVRVVSDGSRQISEACNREAMASWQ